MTSIPTTGRLIGHVRQPIRPNHTFHLEGTQYDHDQSTHATGRRGLDEAAKAALDERAENLPDNWFADPDIFNEARELAAQKALNVPKPTKERIRKNLRSLRKSKRPGGELRGNSYTRRARAEALFEQFGGKERGWCPCVHCGIKLSPKGRDGYGYMQQDKILTIHEGGTYGSKTKFPNLIPACGGCNSSRNDAPFPIRPAWETAAAAGLDHAVSVIGRFHAGLIEAFGKKNMPAYEADAELVGEPGYATGIPIQDPDEPDPEPAVTGPYQVRRVDAWFGSYDQHIIGGTVVDPDTVEEHDAPEDT